MPRDVVMMPSARTEILIDPCTIGLGQVNAQNQCQLPAAPITAVLQTGGADVAAMPGEADTWPAMELAQVVFQGSPQAPLVKPRSIETVAPPLPANPIASLSGTRTASRAATVRPEPAPCTPNGLPSGQVRVIRFNSGELPDKKERFGLRAEKSRMNLPPGGSVIDLPDSNPNLDLQHDYSTFTETPSVSRLCIKHGSREQWVLVNDSGECHNFHLHQVRFKVRRIQAGGTPADAQCLGNRANSIDNDAWHDNFPLPPGARVLIDVTFDQRAQIGKFVYHCHILEHEDSGMMATVEVVL
jgi:FtsP/CotA-like multicopper oxidase with cupredoxin domain